MHLAVNGMLDRVEKCVQLNLPTPSYPDKEIEKVYEEIDNIIINKKAHYNIVMGDFNAKVCPGDIRETCTGSMV